MSAVRRGQPRPRPTPVPTTPRVVDPPKAKTIYEWMAANLPESPNIIEIGAHHCEDTEKFYEMFPGASIVAFEPDPRNLPVIYDKHLNSKHKFRLIPVAVGAEYGETTFYLSGGGKGSRPWDFSSSIRKPKDHLKVHPSVSFVGEAIVTVVDLDHVRLPPETIDFIWCDAQGAEGDIVKGGRNTLARTRYFYTEFDNKELYEGQVNLEQLLAMLPNFEVVGYFHNNVLLRNKGL